MAHPPTQSVSLTLNGCATRVDVPAHERLLDTLRYRLNLPGTKEGCGEGECGACTVLLNGVPANSCLVLTAQMEDCDVQTIESVPSAELSCMLRSGATQCGACTPGVVMTAKWVRDNPGVRQGGATLRQLMAGNLCRCTGYDGIIDGLQQWIDESGGGHA